MRTEAVLLLPCSVLAGGLLAACAAGVASVAAYTYPEYCSKIDEDFTTSRRIPHLSEEAKLLQPKLLHVSTILRHGARTPAGRYDCWSGYRPAWDCSLEEVISPYIEGKVLSDTYQYRKLYDAFPATNVLGGTCGKGHLLEEGYAQHEVLGRLFYQFYQNGTEPLIDTTDDVSGQIFFRSSDMQRTILSASTFLSTFLKNADVPADVDIAVHTMDEENDSIFPNTHICPALHKIKEELFASESFAELQKKYNDLKKRIGEAIQKDDISALWPGRFFDCVMTAVCADQWTALPSALRPAWLSDTQADADAEEDAEEEEAEEEDEDDQPKQNIIDETIAAVDEYATFQYNWKDSQFSKTASSHFMTEFKTEIIRFLLKRVSEKNSPSETAQLMSTMMGTDTLQEFYKHAVSSPTRASLKTPFDAKKLVVYGAHDTTLLAFLASVGSQSFLGKWPPYASQFVFELYEIDDNKYYFRAIYNGIPITDRFDGCDTEKMANDLCEVSTFLHNTYWATPARSVEACGELKFINDPF